MSYDYERKYVESTGITSGFFNSDPTKHDRQYNADQMGSMFDGVIRDGVYSTIGKCFAVNAAGGMKIKIDTGKAWFDHTWIINDSIATIELEAAPITMDRIDAVVIEVNKTEDVRATQICVVRGIASETPVKPTMLHDDNTDQYALAYISVAKQTTEITDSVIENAVGTEETPFVTGVLEQVDITVLLQQWTDQAAGQRSELGTEFNEWFVTVKDTLSGDVAGHLETQITDIWQFINSFGIAEEIEY